MHHSGGQGFERGSRGKHPTVNPSTLPLPATPIQEEFLKLFAVFFGKSFGASDSACPGQVSSPPPNVDLLSLNVFRRRKLDVVVPDFKPHCPGMRSTLFSIA